MGFSHYWKYKTPTQDCQKEFKQVRKELRKVMKNLPEFSETGGGYYKDEPIVLKGGRGTGKPIINTKEIYFNGDSSKDLDHETFYFPFNGKPFDFEFCKTARKPYDFMVCITLLSLRNNVTGFSFSSDGDQEDWEPAVKYYEEHIGAIKQKENLLIND